MACVAASPYNRVMNESFYRDVAPLYDLEFDEFDIDLDLYRGYAEIVGSPILELGCGTGRLLVPLAEAGFDVTGVDASLDMLERARARLERSELSNVDLVHGDMRQLAGLPNDTFRLVFCAVNSFLHLESRVAQLDTLSAVRRVLDDRGVLVHRRIPPDSTRAQRNGRSTSPRRRLDPSRRHANQPLLATQGASD